MNNKEYAKPVLTKHGALKQITFSGNENSHPPRPPFRITWRAAWGVQIIDQQEDVSASKGELVSPSELAQLIVDAQTRQPQG